MSLTQRFRASWEPERGSAIAEFVFTAGLVLLLCAAIIQLAFALHVRNTLIDCAGEGARHAALRGSSVDDGIEYTKTLIASALPERYSKEVTASITQVEGHAVVVVEVHTDLPLVGMVGPATLHATGRALVE